MRFALGLLVAVQIVLAAALVYHYVLAVASGWPRRPRPAGRSTSTRFAIAIPAHNEAAVLSNTLTQLRKQAYPSDQYDIHVVADHCTDSTLEVARNGGAVAHERNSLLKGRKAYALQWLLSRILESSPPYDAIVVFDADSLVDIGFLQAMSARLEAGEKVLQGQHIISNPEDSLASSLAAVDMRLNNRLRNQSRGNLGLSCRLMGDAMVFEADTLRALGWLGESMNEDREFGYELLMHGIRVLYVPEACSYGQAASGRKQAEPQRLRWYRGVTAMQGRLVPRLLSAAARSGSFRIFDGAVELLMPSYSSMVAVSVVQMSIVGVMAALGQVAHGVAALGGSILVGWLLYPVLGLVIDRAPRWAYRALLVGPLYVVWRLYISLMVRIRGDRISWVRTRRREELTSLEPSGSEAPSQRRGK